MSLKRGKFLSKLWCRVSGNILTKKIWDYIAGEGLTLERSTLDHNSLRWPIFIINSVHKTNF